MKLKKRNDEIRFSIAPLLEIVEDPVVVSDENGIIIEANANFAKICGLSRKKVIGKNVRELECFTKGTSDVLLTNLAKRLRGVDIAPYDIELLTRKGEKKHFELKGKRIDYQGKLVDLVVLRDVTSRKRTEKILKKEGTEKDIRLKEKEMKLATIFESSPESITIFDLNGKITDCNQSTVTLHGFSSKEELIGKSAFDLISSKDIQKAAFLMKQIVAVGVIKGLELTFMSKDGTEFPAEGSGALLRDSNGNPSGFVSLTRNVSERFRAEQALKESEGKYRKLFDEAIDAIFVADCETGEIVDCNISASKLVGWEKSELIGKHQSFIHPPGQLDGEFTMCFKEHLRVNEDKILETQVITKNGGIREVAIKANAIEIGGRKLLRGVFKDITERKKAEEKILNLARFPLENPNPIIRIAQDGIVVFANPASTSLLKNLNVAVGKPAPDSLRHLVSAVLSSGLRKEVEVQTNNRVFLFTLAPVIRDAYVNAYGLDITWLKSAEKELQILKEFDNRIIDSLGEALLVIDPFDFTIVKANSEALKQLKLRKSDLVGKTCYQSTHGLSSPCSGPKHVCPIRELLYTGNPVTVEHVHFDGDGNEVIVEVSAFPIKGPDGKDLVIHVSKNVTQRKLMENALRDSEEKFRAISKSVSDALVLVDGQGQIDFWSPSAERIFGYRSEEAVGRFVHDLVVPETSREGLETIKAAMRKFSLTGMGAFVGSTVELTARKKDGCEIPIKLSISPMLLKGKWHAVSLARDITEQLQTRKKLQEYAEEQEQLVAARTRELEEAQGRLIRSERLAAIGELAGMVGHDLRNPLTAIKNSAYFLRKKGNVCSDDGIAMLETVDRAIEHANRIINDLLDYSREMHLELREYSVKSLLEQTLSMIKVPANVELLRPVNHSICIMVDQDKILRVWANLIKNAIDAMPNGGKLEIGLKKTEGFLDVSFSDTGVGISEEVMTKIFTPLFTTKAQGMGFGLAICKRVIDAHGGKITVKSVLNKGTTVTVTLPIKNKLSVGGEKV